MMQATMQATFPNKGKGAPGRAWESEGTVFDADCQAIAPPKFLRADIAKAEGIHSIVCKFQDGCIYEYGSTDTLDACPDI